MSSNRFFMTFGLIASVLFLTVACGASPQTAETPAAAQSEQPPATDSGDIEFLFVQGGDSVSLADGVLTIEGVNKATLFFADRPERVAGHMPTEEFVASWGKGENSFASNPPNADLSIFTDDGTQEIVVVLKEPRIEGDDLIYNVEVLDGDATATGGACSLFIDIIGMPLTPVSYAGVARRATRRAVLY